jgi:hypothetical protein
MPTKEAVVDAIKFGLDKKRIDILAIRETNIGTLSSVHFDVWDEVEGIIQIEVHDTW